MISLFLVHPKHPFTRKKRVIVFLCVLAFAFFVEIALLDSLYYPSYKTCSNGCNEIDGICEGGENDGMKHSKYYDSITNVTI